MGATVFVNCCSSERLDRIAADLDHPKRLVTVKGPLLPDLVEAALQEYSNNNALNHVIAHGAVACSSKKPTTGAAQAVCHPVFSLADKVKFWEQAAPEDFRVASSELITQHYMAAQTLIPHLRPVEQQQGEESRQYKNKATYTFVTGDGSGHPSAPGSLILPIGQIIAHHVQGLAAAMRAHFATNSDHHNVVCRELRVMGLDVNRPSQKERQQHHPRERNLSEDDIGDICAGLIMAAARPGENGRLMHVDSQTALEELLIEYQMMTQQGKTFEPFSTTCAA